MPKIYQLSPQEAQKIAAGQVVERPANVLKELIENSIDAESTHIEIYIENAGQKLIHVTDNGCGMSPEDAQISFNRHATSKIQKIEQLPTISTFGFRGEALASITAVSKVTLITREKEAENGIQIIRTENDNNIEFVNCNPGTDIYIEDLFHNVPARKKFLKKELTEWRQIQYTLQAFILSYKNIHFKVYNDHKLVYNCPATTSYLERMAQIWDISIAKNALTIKHITKNEITVEGAITNQQYYRYDRNSLFLIVNNRWIKNYELSRALLKGYMNVLPPARYPAALLAINVNPLHVDVNVHPRKEEVTFLYPRQIETLVTQAIQETLETHFAHQLQQTKSPQKPTLFIPPTPTNAQNITFTPAKFEPFTYSESTTKVLQPEQPKINYQFQQHLDQKNEFELHPSDSHQQAFTHIDKETAPFTEFNVIGQLHATYILLEQQDGLFIVDQHAAHERILYEKFKQERFGNVATVELLFPVVVEIPEEQVIILEPYLEILHEHGLHIEQFGKKQLIVKAAPVHAQHIAFDLFIKEIISWIEQTNILDLTALNQALHEKIHAQMACKAAIKANDILTQEHMRQLILDLWQTKNRFTCPHGRPTGWLFSQYELEKKFKRKL